MQRHDALAQDYARMQPMFLVLPPAFDKMMEQLARAEHDLNAGA